MVEILKNNNLKQLHVKNMWFHKSLNCSNISLDFEAFSVNSTLAVKGASQFFLYNAERLNCHYVKIMCYILSLFYFSFFFKIIIIIPLCSVQYSHFVNLVILWDFQWYGKYCTLCMHSECEKICKNICVI